MFHSRFWFQDSQTSNWISEYLGGAQTSNLLLQSTLTLPRYPISWIVSRIGKSQLWLYIVLLIPIQSFSHIHPLPPPSPLNPSLIFNGRGYYFHGLVLSSQDPWTKCIVCLNLLLIVAFSLLWWMIIDEIDCVFYLHSALARLPSAAPSTRNPVIEKQKSRNRLIHCLVLYVDA